MVFLLTDTFENCDIAFNYKITPNIYVNDFFSNRGFNMKKYIINPHHGPVTYDLIAVSNHYGGLGGGHCK